MTPTSLLEDSNRGSYGVEDEIKLEEVGRGFSKRNVVSTEFDQSLSNQRERSMALNSEGLEVNLSVTFFSFWKLLLRVLMNLRMDIIF